MQPARLIAELTQASPFIFIFKNQKRDGGLARRTPAGLARRTPAGVRLASPPSLCFSGLLAPASTKLDFFCCVNMHQLAGLAACWRTTHRPPLVWHRSYGEGEEQIYCAVMKKLNNVGY